MKEATWENRIVGWDVVAPDQLLANPKNFRRHPNIQREALRGSLNDLGWIAPVVVNRLSGHLIDGHARVEEALTKGAQVPVAYVELTDAEEAEALAVLDPISAMATVDKEALDALLREVKTGEAGIMAMLADLAKDSGLYLDKPPIDDPGAQIDRAAELAEKWGTQRGQVWEVGRHRVMCGDSTSVEDVERLMDGKKAQALITDPPYGVAYEGGQNAVKRERIEGDDSADLYAPFLAAWMPALGNKAAVYVWFAGSHGGTVYSAVAANGLTVRALLIWNKLNPHYGAFMAQYMQRHEPCLYCVQRDGADWYGPTNEVTVWDVEQPSRNEHHPTQKPVEIMARPMRNSTLLNGIVGDPFLGSGTTIVACEQEGRAGYGMEIDPGYMGVILERLSGLGLQPILAQ